MNPIACVIWYKSHPWLLDRLLCSLANRVDGVVMVDGPFKGIADEPSSPDDNYIAIERWDRIHNLHVLLGEVYESEAHKRTKVARMAHELFPDRDRLLVIDNDEALISDIPDGVPLAASLWQGGHLTARMVRVYPLTPTITWGPNHGHVQDKATVYWDGRDLPGRVGDSTWVGEGNYDFSIFHSPEDKRIQDEYNAYNGYIRPGIEDQ